MIKRILTGFFLLVIVFGVAGSAYAQPVITTRCTPDADGHLAWGQYCSSATNPITASYATMGYWTLGALLQKFGGLDQLGTANSSPMGGDASYLKTIGAFIFMLSFFIAVIMMALGQPPKMYGWFAAGPGIMYFLLFNIVERHGVAWEIGGERQDQRVVWELAYTGLNNPIISSTASGAITPDYQKTGASYAIYVPWFFTKIDEVSSEVIQNVVGLMGIRGELPKDRHQNSAPTQTTNWPLLSTEKWELMENITGAKITNNELRELLVQYMSSECGDKMSEYLNKGAFIKASSSNGLNLPKTLFTGTPDTITNSGTSISTDCSSGNDKDKLLCELNKIRIPTPYAYKQLLNKKTNDLANPGFQQFAFSDNNTAPSSADVQFQATTITCDDWLWMLMTGIRWESALHYINLRTSLDLPVAADSVKNEVIKTDVMDFVFTYDWEFLKSDGTEEPIATASQRQQFMLHMIMAYMIRNEFALAPQLADQNLLPSDRSANYAEEFSRTTNSKNKFAEVYTWAKMLPHVQGMILYLLSIGYPLACVMVLVPGWWKWMITWSSFYVWAKSWDAGFAVIQNIEKSIWANLGNSNNVASLNYSILKLDFPNDVNTTNSVDFVFGPDGKATSILQGLRLTEGTALDLFDRGLILSRSLNHDLVNAYYIYLMSALYFAVPAVTGQLLLGAKSGMSNMVKEGIGGVSSEGGSAARSGAIAEETRHGTMNNMAAEQTFNAKGARQEGLALRALQSKNSAMGLEMRSSALGTRSSLFDQGSQSIPDGKQFGEIGNAAKIAQFDKSKAGAESVMGSMKAAMAFDEVTQLAKTAPAAPGSASPNSSQSAPGTSGAGAPGDPSMVETMKGLGGKAADLTKKGAPALYRAAVQNQQGKLGIESADVAAQRADWEKDRQTGVLDSKQASRDANIQSSMGQLVMGQQARASNEMGGRLTQQANFGMREQSYSQGAKFSNHMSGMMAARGVVAGAFDPKDKPKDLELIGAGGMLGSSYDKAFSYPSNGFMSELGGQVSALSPAVSYASTNYQANTGSTLDLKGNHQRLQGAVTQTAGLLGGEAIATKDPGKGLVALAGAGQTLSKSSNGADLDKAVNGQITAQPISFSPTKMAKDGAENAMNELKKLKPEF